MNRTAVLTALLIAMPTELLAQRPTVEAAAWSISPFVGVARHSPVGNAWGITPDRSHTLVGVHLEAPVLRVGAATLLYAPSITPIMRITHQPGAGSDDVKQSPVWGAGISPFGLALRIKLSPQLAIFGRSTVGAAWFTDQVPVPDSREFNFVLAWGGGVEIYRSAAQSVEIGYKFHHLSNLYSRPQNPGLDANLFYAGWRWYLRPRT